MEAAILLEVFRMHVHSESGGRGRKSSSAYIPLRAADAASGDSATGLSIVRATQSRVEWDGSAFRASWIHNRSASDRGL